MQRLVRLDGARVDLSRLERTSWALKSRAGRAVTREDLLRDVWGHESTAEATSSRSRERPAKEARRRAATLRRSAAWATASMGSPEAGLIQRSGTLISRALAAPTVRP